MLITCLQHEKILVQSKIINIYKTSPLWWRTKRF